MILLQLAGACSSHDLETVEVVPVDAGWSVPVDDYFWPPDDAPCTWFGNASHPGGRLALLRADHDGVSFLGHHYDSPASMRDGISQRVAIFEACRARRVPAVLAVFDDQMAYSDVFKVLYFARQNPVRISILVQATTTFAPIQGCGHPAWDIDLSGPTTITSAGSHPARVDGPVPRSTGAAHFVYVNGGGSLTWGAALTRISPSLSGSLVSLGPDFMSSKASSPPTGSPVAVPVLMSLQAGTFVTVLPEEAVPYDGPCSEPSLLLQSLSIPALEP